MQCRNCGSNQFIPGQQSDMVVCRECGTPGDSSTGRPYHNQPGGQEVTPSEMQVRNAPGIGMGAWGDDPGGNPLNDSNPITGGDGIQPSWRRDDSYASIYASLQSSLIYNPGDTVEIQGPQAGIWAGQTGTVSKVVGPSVYVTLEGRQYPFGVEQLRPAQQKLFSSWNERLKTAHPDEQYHPFDETGHGPNFDSCPYCGSTDLESFDDGSGKLCYNCSSNIYNDPQMNDGQPGMYMGSQHQADSGYDPNTGRPYQEDMAQSFGGPLIMDTGMGLTQICPECQGGMDKPVESCANCGGQGWIDQSSGPDTFGGEGYETPYNIGIGTTAFPEGLAPDPHTTQLDGWMAYNPQIPVDAETAAQPIPDWRRIEPRQGSIFDVTQVIEPGPATVEVDREGEMNPIIIQHDNPEVLDEAKSTLKSAGIFGTLLGLAPAALGAIAAPFTGGASLALEPEALGALAGTVGRGALMQEGSNLLGGGGGGQDANAGQQMGNDLNSLSSNRTIPLESDLGQSFHRALHAFSTGSGKEHPHVADFVAKFDMAYPGWKDRPIRPDHQSELEAIRPKFASIYETLHQAANELGFGEGEYGTMPSKMMPVAFTPQEQNLIDQLSGIMKGNRGMSAEEAAMILESQSGVPEADIIRAYDKLRSFDAGFLQPEKRSPEAQELYMPPNAPPTDFNEFGNAPQGLTPFSSTNYKPGWGDAVRVAADDGFGYDSPNTRREITDTEDPHGDGIDAAVHGDNPDAWQRQDNMQGGGSDSPYPPEFAPLMQQIMQLITQHPELMPRQAAVWPTDNPMVGEDVMGVPCPHCGNPSVQGLICPQCRQPMGGKAENPLQTLMQGMSPITASAGPHNIDQIRMVADYLKQNGTWGPEIAEMLITNPDDPMFAEALAAIQQKGTVPDISQEQPPAPMMPPPGMPPGGGGPGGMPPGQTAPPTQMMQARVAADTAAPPCPKCDSHTTGILDDEGHMKCHACGNSWTTHMEPGDDRHSYGALHGPDWVTQDGQPIEAGQNLNMFTSASPVPDEVTIADVKPNSITYSLTGSYGLSYETEITRQEAEIDGITFQSEHGQDPGLMSQPMPDLETNNDDNTGFVGPTEGTDNLSVQSNILFCTHCESPYEADDPMNKYASKYCMNCAFDIDYGDGLTKTGGKDYTRQEQMALINEQGVARNLSNLSLQGTHYDMIDEDSTSLFW